MRRLRTVEEFIDIACATPPGEPVGLMHVEINALKELVGGFMFGNLLCGRRIVAIHHDWERSLDEPAA